MKMARNVFHKFNFNEKGQTSYTFPRVSCTALDLSEWEARNTEEHNKPVVINYKHALI